LKRLSFIFSFCLFISATAHAQLYSRFLLYGVKDGLSQNSVHAIYRDKEGLIWIGTQDGLNSFDGKRFTVYRYNEDDSSSISDQFILKIAEDNAGNLWVGTRNGLNFFNKRTHKFKRIYLDEKEKHTFQAGYADFFILPDNNVVVKQEGIFIINGNTLAHVKLSSPSLKKSNCFITPSYKAWLIDEDNKFYYSPDIRKNRFSYLGISSFTNKQNFEDYAAVPYKDSLLFFYNKLKASEIIVFDTRYQTVIKKFQVPISFSHLNVISPEQILAATTKGIFQTGVSGKSELLFSGNAGNTILPAGTILYTYKDVLENLWVGTSGNGVAVSNTSFNNFFQIKPSGPNEVITCIARNRNTLYAGTRNGLFKIENFTATIKDKFNSVVSNKSITAITTDNNNNIWAAISGEGVVVMNEAGTIVKKFSIINSEPGSSVLHMNTDSKGRILISTTAGLFIALPNNSPLIHFSHKENVHKLSGSYVMHSFEDKDGNIWIANNSGLDVFNNSLQKKFSFVSNDDKHSFIKRTIVTGTAQDNTGAMWIGTIRSGIYKYHNGKSVHYTTSSGLASDVVYNILCDNKGRLWVATSAGLNVYNESKNSFITLSTADGIPPSAFIFGAALKDKQHLLYGTSEGLLVCNADKAALNEASFRAFVSDVKVNGQSVPIDNSLLKIMPDGKLISFDFACTPAFFSGNLIYQYRLMGQDDEWINLPAGVHTVSYTGLPYKNLSMQVRAAVSVNNLAAAPVYNFVVKSSAPFWKTGIFIGIAIFLFATLIVLLTRMENKRKFNRQLRALQIEQGLQVERVRIGRDLHDNIGAYTSALIAGLNRIQPGSESQEKHVTDLKEYGANIMGFLRETIWMLNTETLTITAFADRFKNYAIRISKNYPEIDFQFSENISVNKTLPPTLMLNIFRIMQEALQNACRHSHALVIAIKVENTDRLYFEISDNGKGFKENGHGENYGLSNMKERANESGFTLSIRSSETGTTVSITENTADAALLTNNE